MGKQRERESREKRIDDGDPLSHPAERGRREGGRDLSFFFPKNELRSISHNRVVRAGERYAVDPKTASD